MINDELRLDRVAIERSVYHQYLTFPEFTVLDLASDPGLGVVRDFYAQELMLQVCQVPTCQKSLAEGKSCRGTVHYEIVDKDGRHVVSFSLDASNCR